MQNLAQLQTRKYDAIGGTFFNHDMISYAYDKGKPHVFNRMMGQLFSSSDMFYGKPFIGMTMAKGKMVEIDTDVYRWSLMNAQEKATRIVDATAFALTTPGLNFAPFQIKLDEGWYVSPDVIEGEHDDYQLKIVDGPVADGNGYLYTVQLQTDNPGKSFPNDLLEIGKEFHKVWTSVSSEFNGEFGSIQFGSSFQLESQVGAFANKFTVTDKLVREDNRMIGLKVPYRGKDGNIDYVEKFMTAAEAKLHDQTYTDMEYQMWKGEKSTQKADNGYFVKTGPGIRQQCRDGHTTYYDTTLTEAFLTDYLDGIFFSRVSHGKRKITAMTGSMGAAAFHTMLANSSAPFLTVDSNWIQRVGGGSARHLSYGAQFTHYQGINGVEVDLIINPLYDDTRFCRRMHPQFPNKPLDSWRMTFLDFGDVDGEDNIKMLTVKDTRRYGYLEGTIDHMGKPKQGASVSALVAGCTYFDEGTAGAWIADVSRCGEIIPEVEA